jgi:hexosaminidase
MMLLSLLLASAASASAYKPSQRMSVALWPMPVEVRWPPCLLSSADPSHPDPTYTAPAPTGQVTNGSTTVAVDSPSWQFTMAAGTEATASLKAAAKRYTSLIFLHGRGSPPPPAAEEEDEEAEQALSGCTVSVANSTEVLGYGMDESYTLSVSVGAPDHSVGGRALPTCSITAGTFVGAIWAMETLSQLILSEGGSLQHHTQGHPHAYVIMNAPWQIKDRPRFQYRGLMIDTSRHFLPMNAIRRQIDGLSFNKMNALHWHMTDAQSTPYDSTVHPKLKDGAFSEGAVYTPEDIKGLVEYARLRGVQIMLEVDMPGHSFAFGVGYPELLVNCSAMYPLETEFWCSSFDISRGEQLYTWLVNWPMFV